MAKLLSQSLLYIAAAALAARGANVVIEDFSGPVDAFFLDDGTAAGLPSSGNSALEKVDDGLRLNYDVARSGVYRCQRHERRTGLGLGPAGAVARGRGDRRAEPPVARRGQRLRSDIHN